MADKLKQLSIDRQPSGGRPRRRVPRWLWLAAIVAAIALAVGIGRTRRAVEVTTVKVTRAWPSAALSTLNATGYVVPQKKAAIASKATGRLEWLGVREGSPVKAGEVIARLESADLEAQVAQAVANVESARARLKQAEAESLEAGRAMRRSRELRAQGFISGASDDNAVSRAQQAQAAVGAQAAAVRQAQAALVLARVNLDNAFIRAPFDGVVLTKTANVGDVISPFNAGADSKGAVVSMADMATLEVEADVSEASLFKARQGQPCEIQLDALPDLRLLGEVRSIVPSVDRAKATVTFKIGFVERDARVLPEMSAKVGFLSRPLTADERQPRLALNPKAVADGAVFVVRDGHARRRPVTLGGKLGDLVEVKAGLALDDSVVLEPGALEDGAAVTEKKP
ncbi:efflux RND transporter periplasmic adaptor subunit [Chitinimonas koreensis]|uniref:efflux RND transporter periplasmic adaptor subunit n=1 Tax=Chitinimonas koreensis TaxID=356302 RepID=UPI000420F40F|nr:efflux RND transporter periplasmic adaptor subunit [Chitinimonas koreensis]QNM97471.1 efflux RND transporter periplasmic adaptor subunit [Chitinimonas koreensis]